MVPGPLIGRCASHGFVGGRSAAHCEGSDIGNDRWHAGDQYGTVLGERLHGRVDAERHSVTGSFTAAPLMLIDGTERARPVESVSRWDETRVGSKVCKTGRVTGKTCGKILGKHFSPNYVPNGNRFVRTDYCAKGGDSGGAVFRDRRAFGIHSGSTDGRCRQAGDESHFGHIEYVENALDVSVVTQ